MKKYLFIITSVLALCAVSCNPELKEADESDAVIETSVPTIAIDQESIAAKGFTATITPAEGTGFYAYAVLKGEAKAVAASKVLNNSVSGALYADLADAADKAALTVTAEGLTTNAYYTIYAVAASEQGILTDVVSQTIRLGAEGPVLTTAASGFDSESGMVYAVATYSDPVSLTGNGKVYAHFYAPNGFNLGDQYGDNAGYYYMNAEYDIEIAADYYYADGKDLVIFLPEEEYVAGAVVTFTWDAGLLVSDKGFESEAYSNSVVVAKGYYYYGVLKGIEYECETEQWELSMAAVEGGELVPYADSTVYAADWMSFGEYITYGDVTVYDTGETSVTYTYKYPGGSKTATIVDDLALIRAGYAAVTLPEDPGFGTTVDIAIPEDILFDKWGNGNAAFEYEDLVFMSYGYASADFYGTYACEAESYWGGAIADTIVIAASDDADYDVMITADTWMGVPCNLALYGDIDGDAGTLVIPDSYFYYAAGDDSETYVETFGYNDADGAIVLSHPTKTTYGCSDWIGAYLWMLNADGEVTKKGYYEMGMNFVATKIADAAPAAVNAPAPENLPKSSRDNELVRVK